jgi:2-keto-4-pentenoate hydratase/2-oxohepta-3-ene-1,7-dioic acid hydratase in catechol pathway
MKLCRFDRTRLGVVENDMILDLTAVLDRLPKRDWIEGWGDPLIARLDQLRPLIEAERPAARRLAVRDVSLDSPVARPSKIIGAPANFTQHIEESKNDPAIAAVGTIKTIAEHGLFLKASSSLVGFGEGVTLRFPDRRTDHEAEFVVVIGAAGEDIAEARALDHVAGYSIGLDITLRGSEERSFRKSVDSYAVLGPWFVTRDEIADPDSVRFRLMVNGVLRQDASTSEMLFSPARLVSLASSFYKLYPGDLIFTGAPAGVGQIQAGDRIDVDCEGIGAGTVLVRGREIARAAQGGTS